MNNGKCMHAAVFTLLLAGAVTGQTTPDGGVPEPAAPPDPPPTPATAWQLGPVTASGLLDGYYGVGFNHPSSHISLLRNFDDKANQIELNMAKLTLDYAPKPVGFHVDAGFGRTFDIISATEKDVTPMRFFEQAYVSVKPAAWKGAEVDFGRFVTLASAEVVETSGNFNYSRSLAYVWCTPYYNFGMQAKTPIGKQFTAGLQWVAGWNNIVTGATYRTVGLTGIWAKPKFTWTNTYYGGPDENKANRGMRNLYDTVLLLTPNSKTNFYVNFDYYHNSPKYSPAYQVVAIAGAAKIQVTKKFFVSPRLELLNDHSGNVTGAAQQVKEFTLTGQYTLRSRLLGYAEFRHDWSDQPYFNRGNEPGSWKNQPTVLIGMVAIVGPQR